MVAIIEPKILNDTKYLIQSTVYDKCLLHCIDNFSVYPILMLRFNV